MEETRQEARPGCHQTGLDFRAQAKGCSLLESSAEQMFPYLPCY